MRIRTLTAMAVAASLLTLSAPAQAIDVTPMVTRITAEAAQAGYRLSVKNTSAMPITVELTPFKMSVDENGKRTLVEEQDDLILFPPQSIIPPNREQVVQVRYVGEAQLNEGRMYLIRAAQLPVPLASDTSQPVGATVNIAFNVNTHLFISPDDAKATLTVVSSERAANGDVLMTVRNTGNGIAHLRTARYGVAGAGGARVDIDASQVEVGEVSALAGGAVRHIRIPAALLSGVPSDAAVSIELQ